VSGLRSRSTVSVIVCAHSDERVQLLQESLDSLERQSMRPREILVVVDHNEDLRAMAAENFPGVRVFANPGAPGLSAARNAGIRQARGDIVAFMDDDAVAPDNWLLRLIQHYADPRVAAVGGAVLPDWPSGRPTWFPPEFDWVVGCSYKGQPEKVAVVRNLLGCNMSFRRAVFDHAGLFSETLGRGGNNAAGCEETELCIRALQCFPSARIIYDPGLTVLHRVARERLTHRYYRARCFAEGRSKASMTTATGARDGLASERSHVLHTLPAGVARGVSDAFRGDRSGLSRSAAIIAGLVYTMAGFLLARVGARDQPAPADRRAFAPMCVLEVDLARPLTAIDAIHADTGERYGGAFCLVRMQGRPLRVVEFPLLCRSLPASELRTLLGPAPASPAPYRLVSDGAPFVRVVVATRDRPDSLGRCLDSLLRQDYGAFEVVVVDNAPSSNQTAEMIASRYAGIGNIRYLREDRPGLGHAHNRATDDLTAGLAAFTDDDVVVDGSWLRVIASNFATSATVGCVTGLILPAELRTRAQYWTERHGGFGKGFERRLFDALENRPPDRLFPFAAGSFGSGANMAFRAEVLRRLGNFDAALGAGTLARGGDDLAAFVSVVRSGYQLVYDPAALVWHHHRPDERDMGRQAYGYGVGLGSYLMKTSLDDPGVLLHFVRTAPWAVAHLVNPASSKNRRLPADYPAMLKWKERAGVVVGFWAYLRSRAALRRYLHALNGEPRPIHEHAGHGLGGR
jgi:O-antigen biosynthesis protein